MLVSLGVSHVLLIVYVYKIVYDFDVGDINFILSWMLALVQLLK